KLPNLQHRFFTPSLMFVSKRLSVIFGEFKTVVIGYFTIVDYITFRNVFARVRQPNLLPLEPFLLPLKPSLL
ncbi:hypothetical protein, partial [Bacillus luti]